MYKWDWDTFWRVYKVMCWTLFIIGVWLVSWVLVAVGVTSVAGHVAGTLTGMAWGLGTLMLGGWLTARATRPTMEELTESEPDVRIHPVILKPHSSGNETGEWRVVKGDDWLAYINGQRDYLAYVPFVHESEAKAFREHLIANNLS